MALHALQDRQAHLGMTNAEHAWLYLRRDDPDLVTDALARGEVVTRHFLTAFIQTTLGRAHPRRCHPWAAFRGLVDPPDSAQIDVDLPGYLWNGFRWLRTGPPIVRWPPPSSA
jgi:hypothetical protein